MTTLRWIQHPSGLERRELLDPSGDLEAQLRELLQAHDSDAPVLAELQGPRGDRLLIGLGRPLSLDAATEVTAPVSRPLSCLVIETASGASQSSRGSEFGADDSLVWFLDGHWTELPGRVAVDLDVAAAAAGAYLRGRDPSGHVVLQHD